MTMRTAKKKVDAHGKRARAELDKILQSPIPTMTALPSALPTMVPAVLTSLMPTF